MNVIGLTTEHENNLRKLVSYLLKGIKHGTKFDMKDYSDNPLTHLHQIDIICGTVGCAVGHAPYAGVLKHTGEDWSQFCGRVFGIIPCSYYWYWAFGPQWRQHDNTPEGAACRILWLLDKGLPDTWQGMMHGNLPESYKLVRDYHTSHPINVVILPKKKITEIALDKVSTGE